MPVPQLSVVVASQGHVLRLRWLLNALEQQTLDRSRWEVVVCHDASDAETGQILATHPLSASGTLRWTSLPGGGASPGASRNAALRLAGAETIVFTDDDCRPPCSWLENVLSAVERNPGAIVQGPIQGDPDEFVMRLSPHPRIKDFSRVPRLWAETCNIAYPRAVVERIGGFIEDVRVGEDTDLNIRARRAGAPYVGDGQMVTYHAIEEGSILTWVRDAWRQGDLALLVKRHPEVRSELPLGLFYKRVHALAAVGFLGLALAPRRPICAVLAVPWAIDRQPRGDKMRGRVRQLIELPGWMLTDLAELTALARASVRYRTLFL